jgi:hypothetical protein
MFHSSSYEEILEDAAISRKMNSQINETPSTSSRSQTQQTKASSFAVGCALSLAVFAVTSSSLSKTSGSNVSYDSARGNQKTNEVLFNNQKFDSEEWMNGLVDTSKAPQEQTNWVVNHPKVRAMMSASAALGMAIDMPELGKSTSKKSSSHNKHKNKEEDLDFDVPDGSKLPEHVDVEEEKSKNGGGMQSTKRVKGKIVTLDENGNINTAPMGRTTTDNYRMSWATEHVVFTNGDYSANYIPMKESWWKNKFKQVPGQGWTKPKDSGMTVDDLGTLTPRKKMPASQLGEIEKDDDDNEIVPEHTSTTSKKKSSSSKEDDDDEKKSSSSSKSHHHH